MDVGCMPKISSLTKKIYTGNGLTNKNYYSKKMMANKNVLAQVFVELSNYGQALIKYL